jgi:hypothetical protein
MRTSTRTGHTSTPVETDPPRCARARAWRNSTRTVRSFCTRSLGVSTAGARVRPLLSRVVSVLFTLDEATRASGWDTRASSSRTPHRSWARACAHGRWGGCGWGVVLTTLCRSSSSTESPPSSSSSPSTPTPTLGGHGIWTGRSSLAEWSAAGA